MVKNTLPEHGTPEPLEHNEDNLLNVKKIEGEKKIHEKAEIREDASDLLDELKSRIDKKEDSLDTLFAPGVHDKHAPSSQKHKNDGGSFPAFSSLNTRGESDIGKGPIRALSDSLLVFGGATKDIVFDVGKIFLSPIQETQRTIAYLEEESSVKII